MSPYPYRRLLLVAGLSLLLHGLALTSLPGLNMDTPIEPAPLQAHLNLAEHKPAASKPPQAKPKPAPRHKPAAPAPANAPLPSAISTIPEPAVSDLPAESPVAVNDTVPVSVAQDSAPPAMPLAATPAPPATLQQPASDPPSPLALHYRAEAIQPSYDPPRHTFGSGEVTWRPDGDKYSLDLRAGISIFFASLTVLSSHSEGRLDANGLEPDIYLESPRGRAAVATHFNRDPASPLANTISFSASTSNYPLQPGAQDNVSVIMQLAGILRASPDLMQPASSINIVVAGVRGEVVGWRFIVIGNEEADTPVGKLPTLHIQRPIRPGTNDRLIDLWYALDENGKLRGYPARIRYAEFNGSIIDLTLKEVGIPAPR